MIVLDTDAISNLTKPRPASTLQDRLRQVSLSEMATTAINIGELAYGAVRANRQALYERMIELLDGVSILPFDFQAAEEYASLRVTLEQQGRRLDEADLRIAAIAVSRGATLVTGNVRHFGRVPRLVVENWLEP